MRLKVDIGTQMTMPQPEVVRVQSLRAKIEARLRAGRVQVVDDFDRDSYVLILRGEADERLGEIELSLEAVEDLPEDFLVDDLERHGALDRAGLDPTVRRSYRSDRTLTPGEWRVIECDGAQYIVVRDRGHVVTILDAHETPLRGAPEGRLVLPTSIHRRPVEDWCRDIRAWRSPHS